MNLLNVCNSVDINSYFSFSLWFQILRISSFRLCSAAPENMGSKSCTTLLKFVRKKVFKLHIFFCWGYHLETIDVKMLSLNSFILKTLKEVQLKCEVCYLGSYTHMLINTDMLAFRFWLKCISSLFKWTIVIKIWQNVH